MAILTDSNHQHNSMEGNKKKNTEQLLYYFLYQAPSFTEYVLKGPIRPLGFFATFFSCSFHVNPLSSISPRCLMGSQLQCLSRNCWFL